MKTVSQWLEHLHQGGAKTQTIFKAEYAEMLNHSDYTSMGGKAFRANELDPTKDMEVVFRAIPMMTFIVKA